MKAFILKKYGLPKAVLEIKETERPVPGKDEVLIKIHATAINDYDWSQVRGKPFLYRLMFGFSKPKHLIPGMELSGTIEALGSGVQDLKIGDAVYGDTSDYGFGTFAEYISIHQNAVVKKPIEMNFEEAASIPHASLLALQAFDLGNIKHKQKVLINGAGGGVGTFGFQLAKLHECEVTGVDTGEKLKMMKVAGFDHVIDYKKENFTKNGIKYDLILDCKSDKSPFSYLRSLNSPGKYITVGGKLFTLFKILLWGKTFSLFSSKRLIILALKPNQGLERINELFRQKKLKCTLDGPYPFEKIPELIQYFGDGKHAGKIVIKMN